MKLNIIYGGLLIVLLAALAMSAKGAKASDAKLFGRQKDTLSNALKDTTVLSSTLYDQYTYRVAVRLTHISGTRAIKIYLDESNGGGKYNSGVYTTGYLVRDSITPSATATEVAFTGLSYGAAQRIRVSGNTGATQAEAYTVSALYK